MLRKKDYEKQRASFGQVKNELFNFTLIAKYFENKDQSKTFQVLSDKTCNDLDIEELFQFVDRTTSKVGQQYLYNKLRTIPESSLANELNEQVIQKFEKDSAFRIKIQQLLSKLNKEEVYYISSLFQELHITPPKWFFIIRLLSFTSLLLICMLPFNPQFLFLLIGVFLTNIAIHYWNKKNLFQYLGSIPQLLKLSRIATKLYKEKALQPLNPNLPESIKVIDKVRNRMSFFQLEARLQGDIEALFWGILELIKTVFLLEPLLLFGVLKQLNTKRIEIENVFSFVGKIDALVSIASLREGLETYCLPTINETANTITANEIYHPLIADCVTNSIQANSKSILLTGSNMSGKTSFIRTIGLNLITGLTLNTCFAKLIIIPRVRIYSAIRISDDLMNDKSYYLEEVLTIKEMIDKSNNEKQSIFLLDEIFKGTNTIERISAGKAILSSLSNNGNKVFVSTHDIELADLLAKEYELYHFSELIDDKNFYFDYKLKEGMLKNRNAIRILQINDYPEKVIIGAMEISQKLDEHSVQRKTLLS